MNTLLHLCKKDFTFAKPWILGTWFALAISNVLPWISPEGKAGELFMMIRLLAPAVMVFLASTQIIHCDSFVGTSGFMGTRPVRAATLLRNKLVLIAFVLVLPAVGFALLHAACMRVNLSALEWLLLFIENWLYFSLIAGAAVAYAVISRNVGIMVILIIATPFLFLMLLALFNLNWPFGNSLENQHLKASFQLVAQAFLSVAAVAIAMSWVALRRIWLTAAGFLLCAAFLVAPGVFWKWNFVDNLSKDVSPQDIVSDSPSIEWAGAATFSLHSMIDDTPYWQVSRPGRVAGPGKDWTGRLISFKSEAHFRDGNVMKSERDTSIDLSGDVSLVILPELGIDLTGKQFSRVSGSSLTWTVFVFEKSRIQKLSDHRATIRGTGTFQLDQPFILAEVPAQVGASVVSGRTRYRIDHVSIAETQISIELSGRGVPLTTFGDRAKRLYETKFLLVNPDTQEFATVSNSAGFSRAGGEWETIRKTFSINQQLDSAPRAHAEKFLKGARLYILGTRYGGSIELPFEIPEMLLEEKR